MSIVKNGSTVYVFATTANDSISVRLVPSMRLGWQISRLLNYPTFFIYWMSKENSIYYLPFTIFYLNHIKFYFGSMEK